MGIDKPSKILEDLVNSELENKDFARALDILNFLPSANHMFEKDESGKYKMIEHQYTGEFIYGKAAETVFDIWQRCSTNKVGIKDKMAWRQYGKEVAKEILENYSKIYKEMGY